MSDYRIKVVIGSRHKPLAVTDKGSFTLGGVIDYLEEATQWLHQPAMYFEGSDDQLLQLRALEALHGIKPVSLIQTSGIIESLVYYKFNSIYLAVVVVPNEI